MSIWNRISNIIAGLGQVPSLAHVFERLHRPPQYSVAFTIAVIALGAKMAKADGRVTVDEINAFREVFHIAPADEANAARVFDLARRDVAGYQDYARRIRRLFAENDACLIDVLEGLFYIAAADGYYHPNEDRFLTTLAEIWGIPWERFQAIRARFAPQGAGKTGGAGDPYHVLGLTSGAPLAEVRRAWRRLVRETHPDAMAARGLPPEAIGLANGKMAAINAAWAQINGKAC
ncbi:MAG: DnaJ family molecular chaperone [Rhodobacteraceae bacterium]|nr:DnaJ family molecular chaperone [Paracoccaceae bacterium]